MAVRGNRADEVLNHLKAIFLVSHLATAELQAYFYLHFLAKKIDRMGQLDLEIVRIDRSAELDFFDLVSVLMFLGFLIFLGLLVTEFSIID